MISFTLTCECCRIMKPFADNSIAEAVLEMSASGWVIIPVSEEEHMTFCPACKTDVAAGMFPPVA